MDSISFTPGRCMTIVSEEEIQADSHLGLGENSKTAFTLTVFYVDQIVSDRSVCRVLMCFNLKKPPQINSIFWLQYCKRVTSCFFTFFGEHFMCVFEKSIPLCKISSSEMGQNTNKQTNERKERDLWSDLFVLQTRGKLYD